MPLRIAAYAARSALVLWALTRFVIFLFEGPLVLGGLGSLGFALAAGFVVAIEQRRANEVVFLENLGISRRFAPAIAVLVVAALELTWTIGVSR